MQSCRRGGASNERINLMRRSAPIDWERSAHRSCARRWTRWLRRKAREHQGIPHQDHVSPRRFGWFFAGAVFGGFAACVVSILPTDLVGTSGRGGVVFTAVLAAVISAYAFWRATRFRIAREAAEVGGSPTLTAPRWSVTLQPSDVRKVLQLRLDPYGFGFFAKQPWRAWRAWFRIDVSTDERRVRSYLVWRPDARAFLDQLRRAGFQVAGEGAWDQ